MPAAWMPGRPAADAAAGWRAFPRDRCRAVLHMATNRSVKYKLVAVGNSGSGKSSLLLRYARDEFDKDLMVSAREAIPKGAPTVAGR